MEHRECSIEFMRANEGDDRAGFVFGERAGVGRGHEHGIQEIIRADEESEFL